MPSVTDWIQSGVAVVALVISIISLMGSRRQARRQRALALQVEAERQEGFPDGWMLHVLLNEAPRNTALDVTVEVVSEGDIGVFAYHDIPHSVFIVPDGPKLVGPDLTELAGRKRNPAATGEMNHFERPATVAHQMFGLLVDPGRNYVIIEVRVRQRGVASAYVKRTVTVSPVRP